MTVTGKGGHAAFPHRTVDPILAACHVVVALQGIVSRQISPRQSAVITIGVIEGGTKENVIPEVVTLRGTVRTLDVDVREQMPGRIQAVAGGVATAYGASAEVEYRRGYDVLVNEPAMTALARARPRTSSARSACSRPSRAWPARTSGATCSACRAASPPSAVAGLEVPPAERAGAHSPRFALDPGCLPYGVAWYQAVARRYFGRSG